MEGCLALILHLKSSISIGFTICVLIDVFLGLWSLFNDFVLSEIVLFEIFFLLAHAIVVSGRISFVCLGLLLRDLYQNFVAPCHLDLMVFER